MLIVPMLYTLYQVFQASEMIFLYTYMYCLIKATYCYEIYSAGEHVAKF